MKTWTFAILCAASVVLWSGCSDSDGEGLFQDFPNFGEPMDFGPDARNIGVTVRNDIQQTVEVEYWSLPDPSPQAGGKAFYEEMKLPSGTQNVLPVAFRRRSGREDVESVTLHRQDQFFTSVEITETKPRLSISQVQSWSPPLNLTNLPGTL